MQKTFTDLNIIQKLSIRIWNKRHMIHLSALRELHATDVINIYTHELLFSYLSTVRTVTDTNFLEVTKYDGTNTRKDYFSLKEIYQYTILTDPVNNITAPH